MSRAESPALSPGAAAQSIAAVERDTGLSKDTLRVWERRYGFPRPERDSLGERAYPPGQVQQLRLIKRLLDAGHRPGQIVGRPPEELDRLGADTVDAPPVGAAAAPANDLQAPLDLLKAHDLPALRRHLSRQLSRLGVSGFVVEVVAPLNTAVGDAWMRGELEVHEEHVYTEAVQGLLRQAIAAMPEPAKEARPRVLLGTLPGEPHGLGLLMAEVLLLLEGCHCVSLGVQTPVPDIASAAAAFRSDIVAIGFTGCTNPNRIVDAVRELRAVLPATVDLWCGGRVPVLQRRELPGARVLPTLEQIAPQLEDWRSRSLRRPKKT